MKTILVVDDKKSVRQLLGEYLSEQGYRVLEAANGQAALALAGCESLDLILLDVMMPQMDGYQFIGRFRRHANTPIIMLTAKREERDIVRGFELGADDYIIKPFKMRVLLMRIRAVLRRVGDSAEKVLTLGNITLDKQNRMVKIAGERIDLTPIELCLFEYLCDSAEQHLSRAALSAHLIEHGYTGSESTLKIHIRNIRQKVEPIPSTPRYIETVFGYGYRLRVESGG